MVLGTGVEPEQVSALEADLAPTLGENLQLPSTTAEPMDTTTLSSSAVFS